MTVFKLPDLGEGLPDAEIVRWLVKAGDAVRRDQPIVEMETAKAIVEIPSPIVGIITTLHGQAGDIIKTGDVLITFKDTESSPSRPVTAKPDPVNIQRNATAIAPTNNPSDNYIFHLPDLGEGLPDAEIVEWRVQPGQAVTRDQILASMETAKAVVDVPSPIAGTLTKLHGQVGDIIKTGNPLVEIRPASAPRTHTESPSTALDDTILTRSDTTSDTTPQTPTSTHTTTPKAGPAARSLAKRLGINIHSTRPTGPKGFITTDDIRAAAQQTPHTQDPEACFNIASGKTVLAAPKVRALAQQHNIDLNRITPSGHVGNVTQTDIHRIIQHKSANTHNTTTLPIAGLAIEAIPIRGARRSMFNSMSQARDRVMNTTLFDDADVCAWAADADTTIRFMRAIISACRAEPGLNAWLDDTQQLLIQHKHINLGIAVDSAHGLYVPVIKNVEQKTAPQLRSELNRLREAIKARASKPEDLQNASITLSNFGMLAGRYATPIVNPPQVAILATGKFYDVLKLDADNTLNKARHIPLSLSFDHRAVTGGEAARFLAAIIEDLNQPH